jgi:putative SOS response-associated peptidase YedK
MCGRFVSATDAAGIVRFFTVDDRQTEDLPPNHNTAPTESAYAVVEHAGRRALVSFRWGLVPHWAEDLRVGSRMINARAETLASKPAFRDALAHRRCIVPVDGFYEWRRDGDKRTPFLLHPVAGGLLALAGLWSVWRDPAVPDGEPVRTFSIITGAAGPDVEDLHARMPVIVGDGGWDEWLDRDERNPAHLRHLLRPAPPGTLVRREVSTAVNDARHKGAHLVEAP